MEAMPCLYRALCLGADKRCLCGMVWNRPRRGCAASPRHGGRTGAGRRNPIPPPHSTAQSSLPPKPQTLPPASSRSHFLPPRPVLSGNTTFVSHQEGWQRAAASCTGTVRAGSSDPRHSPPFPQHCAALGSAPPQPRAVPPPSAFKQESAEHRSPLWDSSVFRYPHKAKAGQLCRVPVWVFVPPSSLNL